MHIDLINKKWDNEISPFGPLTVSYGDRLPVDAQKKFHDFPHEKKYDFHSYLKLKLPEGSMGIVGV